MKILIAGTFDLFHKGHEFFIISAIKYVIKTDNSELHVIISRDENVKKIKNKTPYNGEHTRKNNVKNFIKQYLRANNYTKLKFFVYLGDKNNFLKLPQKIQPNIICFGYDQKAPNKLLAEQKSGFLQNCKFIKADAYFPTKYKTSILKS